MSRGYKLGKVIKKSIVFFMILSICLGTEIVFSSKAAKAATSNYDLYCSATAYTAKIGSLTASGIVVERKPEGISTVAVDPSVIPFGTYLYIEDYGYAVAADKGSAIKGNEVDIFFNNYDECYNWGRKTVKITVLGDSTNL